MTVITIIISTANRPFLKDRYYYFYEENDPGQRPDAIPLFVREFTRKIVGHIGRGPLEIYAYTPDELANYTPRIYAD